MEQADSLAPKVTAGLAGAAARRLRGGKTADGLLLASVAVMAAVPHIGLPSALRETLVIAYILTVPGWSVARLLRLARLDLEVTAALAVSFVLPLVAGWLMLAIGSWHPYAPYLLSLVVTAVAAVWARLR